MKNGIIEVDISGINIGTTSYQEAGQDQMTSVNCQMNGLVTDSGSGVFQ